MKSKFVNRYYPRKVRKVNVIDYQPNIFMIRIYSVDKLDKSNVHLNKYEKERCDFEKQQFIKIVIKNN